MYHKNRAYRRHQSERVIHNRTELFRNTSWGASFPEDHLYFTEPNRLDKRRPFGSCGGHCSCCDAESEWKAYKNSWRKAKDDIAARQELAILENWKSFMEDCICEDEILGTTEHLVILDDECSWDNGLMYDPDVWYTGYGPEVDWDIEQAIG